MGPCATQFGTAAAVRNAAASEVFGVAALRHAIGAISRPVERLVLSADLAVASDESARGTAATARTDIDAKFRGPRPRRRNIQAGRGTAVLARSVFDA
jgi:hypothetical protein